MSRILTLIMFTTLSISSAWSLDVTIANSVSASFSEKITLCSPNKVSFSAVEQFILSDMGMNSEERPAYCVDCTASGVGATKILGMEFKTYEKDQTYELNDDETQSDNGTDDSGNTNRVIFTFQNYAHLPAKLQLTCTYQKNSYLQDLTIYSVINLLEEEQNPKFNSIKIEY